MEAIAKSTGIKISTRKVRIVADAVRDMSVQQALSKLSLIEKRGAYPLTKAIKSAVANAVNNNKMKAANLIIAKLEVNEGPFLKRFRPSTRGRVHPYKKRSSHITVILREGGTAS